jgi:4-diphosphocytidyl-2-C-methyl-D-erythritol kinase
LRSIFQSLAVHDTLTFCPASGSFHIDCDDSACPTDRTNLVWRAAAMVWQAAGRGGEPADVVVQIVKRIPLQAGLGGGSSDAAAAIRGLTRFWGLALPDGVDRRIAGRLGADVPFFLVGGTALGLDRGDLLYRLADPSPLWVTLVIPPFGVNTTEAFGWFDEDEASKNRRGSSPTGKASQHEPSGIVGERASTSELPGELFGQLPTSEFRNDLQAPVAARHPEVTRIIRALRRRGARYAAMSGSGSAVFGLFRSRAEAALAAKSLAIAGRRTIVTRTVHRAGFEVLSSPLARLTARSTRRKSG